MSNIDKREIHNQQLKAFITGFLGDPAHDNQSSRSLTAEVFRIALASLEAEAVADEHYKNLSELYHAQEKRLFKLAQRIKGPSFDKYAHSTSQAIDVLELAIFGEREEDCLDAMLQGAEPVTTDYKLPANTPCKEAPEHIWLQTAGVWPENGEFSELTWCSDNQHTDDTLYVRADVVADNSPVIPDGWVLVPIEPTEDMCDIKHLGLDVYTGVATDDYYSIGGEQAAKAWKAMLSKSPKLENRNGY